MGFLDEIRSVNQNTARLERENQNYLIIIAALVKMLGGAVTINEYEMADATKLELEAEENKDPVMFIIRIKEPE